MQLAKLVPQVQLEQQDLKDNKDLQVFKVLRVMMVILAHKEFLDLKVSKVKSARLALKVSRVKSVRLAPKACKVSLVWTVLMAKSVPLDPKAKGLVVPSSWG